MNCLLCQNHFEELLVFPNSCVVNQLVVEPRLLVPTFDLTLWGCPRCGFSRLQGGPAENIFYEEYATPSAWKYEPHVPKLVENIIRLVPKDVAILDVGCNDGKFLDLLRGAGYSNLYGLEPSKNTREIALAKNHRIFSCYLNDKSAQEVLQHAGPFELVTLRQVLEHVTELISFGQALRQVVSDGGLLVIEVPDFENNIKNLDYSLWEEHVNYFTRYSLTRYLDIIGFQPIIIYKTLFSGECLTVIARKKKQPSTSRLRANNPAESIGPSLRDYADSYFRLRSYVNRQIKRKAQQKTGSVILHGVGSRSSFFVNAMGIAKYIKVAVDDNVHKQRKFMPNAGIAIVGTDQVDTKRISLCLLGVNSENEAPLRNFYPTTVEVKSILPPSDLLLWKNFL